jgi:hypothetical protein
MTKYCYSFDEEESFTGDFDSHEDALAEAVAENYDDREIVYIGVATPAKDILVRDAKRIGAQVFETLADNLGDDIGEAVEYFTMTTEQQKELSLLIINHIEERVGFNCFGVSNVTEHALPLVESEGGEL